MNPEKARNSLRAGDLVGVEARSTDDVLEYVRIVDVGERGVLVYGPATGNPRDLFGLAFELVEDYRPREHEDGTDLEDRFYLDEKDRDGDVFEPNSSLAAVGRKAVNAEPDEDESFGEDGEIRPVPSDVPPASELEEGAENGQ